MLGRPVQCPSLHVGGERPVLMDRRERAASSHQRHSDEGECGGKKEAPVARARVGHVYH